MLGVANVELSRITVVYPEDNQGKHGMRQSHLKEMKASKDIAKGRNAWNSFIFIRNHPTHTRMENYC